MGNVDCSKACQLEACAGTEEECGVKFVGGDGIGRENTNLEDSFLFLRENTTADDACPFPRENTTVDDAAAFQRENTTVDDSVAFQRENTSMDQLAPIEECLVVDGVPQSRTLREEVSEMGTAWLESEDTFDNPNPDVLFGEEQAVACSTPLPAVPEAEASPETEPVKPKVDAKQKGDAKQKAKSKKKVDANSKQQKDEQKSSPPGKAFTFKERKQIWSQLPDAEKEATAEQLNMAAKSGNMDAVAKILDAGYVANHPDQSGCTAMHIAAQAGHAKVVEALLAAGGNSASVTKAAKMTPLHLAAKSMNREVLEVLVPRSNVKVTDKNGRTAADLAKGDVKEWLGGNPANTHPPWKSSDA
mmetsp:Transcript_128622/g.235802  ORF Transcript_128622/g.235802 Transcript_128622/m.235802 type:complete len:359 (+) Transcript_128622:56-1132(+)